MQRGRKLIAIKTQSTSLPASSGLLSTVGFEEVVSHFVYVLYSFVYAKGSKAVLNPIVVIYADASYLFQQQQPTHLYLLWAGEPGQIHPTGQCRTAVAAAVPSDMMATRCLHALN